METTSTETPKVSKLQPVDMAQFGTGLYTETVTIDPKADAFAIAPPVEDGWYVSVLRAPRDTPMIQFGTSEAKEGRASQKYFIITFRDEIQGFVDPNKPLDSLKGRKKLLDEDDVSTFVRVVDGAPTSGATTLLAYLGISLPVDANGRFTATNEQIAAAVKQQIDNGNARVAIRTQWKAGWVPKAAGEKYGKWAFAGMQNFPKLRDGMTPNPVVIHNGEERRANAHVVERRSLASFAAAPAGQ